MAARASVEASIGAPAATASGTIHEQPTRLGALEGWLAQRMSAAPVSEAVRQRAATRRSPASSYQLVVHLGPLQSDEIPHGLLAGMWDQPSSPEDRTREGALGGPHALDRPARPLRDGNGLYLVVDASGAKRWILRTVVRGKRDIGLGGLRLVSLAEAREQALAYRKLARNGGEPLAERRRERRPIPTIEEAARAGRAEHSPAWRNAKHATQQINTLAQFTFTAIGDRSGDQIDTPDVRRVLAPIWLTKPETPRRVRQRVGTVLDWAKAAGFRSTPRGRGAVIRLLACSCHRQSAMIRRSR